MRIQGISTARNLGQTRTPEMRDLRSMATKLLCGVGRHEWKRKRNDEGRPYKECTRCGKCSELTRGGPGDWVAAG